jgi:hypothetical protein
VGGQSFHFQQRPNHSIDRFNQRLHDFRSKVNFMSHPSQFSALRASLLALAGGISVLATGCGVAGSSLNQTVTATPASAATVQGLVHGGNQPVVGATLQLYYAGTPATGSGYGVGATPLLNSTVKSDANGNFSITGLYTCPTPAAQVYIVATGGNPGLGGTVNNTALAMMTALGTCPAGSNLLASMPFITINEVTTVAAVTALQQFMAAPASANALAPNIGAPVTAYATGTSVGSIKSAVIGMNNAFVTAKVLADPALGVSPNANYAYATPESAKINTIADIIAYCINSDPSSTTNCSSLFTAATPSGKTTAADTIQAVWYMAQNPINNVTTLYNFVTAAGAPFQPTYLAPGALNSAGTAPATNAFNDTTIAINYAPTLATLPTVGAAYGIAIDAFGNAWVANDGGVGGVSASAVELGVDGSALITPATTYTANATTGSVPQFTSAPTSNTRTFSAPKQVAIDLNNRAWISNYGDAITATTAGASASSLGVFAGSTTAGIAGAGGGIGSTGFYVGSGPQGLAVDGANNVFVINSTSQASTALDGSSVASLVSSPGNATDGTYTYSTSTTATAPYRTPGGTNVSTLVIDTNPNVTGGIVWAGDANACKITGQYNASTYFGTLNLFADSSLAPLAGSDAVSSFSNATVGPGSSTNCGSSSTSVGQVFTAGANNITGLAIDRNNGVWIVDVRTSNTGFDGLTYLTAPTASTGVSPSSYYLVNGVAPNQTTVSIPGTTLTKAGAVAVDGNNNAWIGNQSASSVVEATLQGSTIVLDTPGQGGNYGTTGAAYGIGFVHNISGSLGTAVDPSGNVWFTNNGTGNTYTAQGAVSTNVGNSVTVIVGAAGPVVTPLALAIKSSKLGAKP